MSKTTVQQWARDNGLLVYGFSQAESPVVTEPGPWGGGDTSSGYCAGLALKWLQLRSRGRDFHFDPKTLTARKIGHWEAIKLHNIAKDVHDGLSTQIVKDTQYDQMTKAERKHSKPLVVGLILAAVHHKVASDELRMHVDPARVRGYPGTIKAALLVQQISSPPGLYMVEMRSDRAGHAMAVHSAPESGGDISFRLFDANYGHFHCATAAVFHSFMSIYLTRTNYFMMFRANWNICRLVSHAKTAKADS